MTSPWAGGDSPATFDAGWSERDLRDAVLTASLFKVVSGLQEVHRFKGRAALQAVQGQAPTRVWNTARSIRLTAS